MSIVRADETTFTEDKAKRRTSQRKAAPQATTHLVRGKVTSHPIQLGKPVPAARTTAKQSVVEAATASNAIATDACAGSWSALPVEVIEKVLMSCSPQQLGMLEATCSYFSRSGITENVAKQRLKAIPRAKGLKPGHRERERWVVLLHFVGCQSAAAAQATAIAFGSYHTAALFTVPGGPDSNNTRHSLYTFGRGFYGQLGTGDTKNSSAPSLISLGFRPCQENPELEEENMPAVVVCGRNHTAAISRRGELFTWGFCGYGELGLGEESPIQVKIPRCCLQISVRVVSVAAGANHTLAIAEDGALWTCGKGRQGQLGHGTLNNETEFVLVKHLRGKRIVSAAAGVAHSLALASDGSLFAWGDGQYGQLGRPELEQVAAVLPQQAIIMPLPQRVVKLDPTTLPSTERVTAIAAGNHHSVALTVGGSVLVFGLNSTGALGTGDVENKWKPTKVCVTAPDENILGVRVVQVACGGDHTVALVCLRGLLQVRATGCNRWGQLGLGDTKDRNTFTAVPGLQGVSAVQAGDHHAGAITTEGDLYVWGRGDCGQLATSDCKGRRKPFNVAPLKIVHPDKTLRRSKRNTPLTRPANTELKRAKLVHVLQ